MILGPFYVLTSSTSYYERFRYSICISYILYLFIETSKEAYKRDLDVSNGISREVKIIMRRPGGLVLLLAFIGYSKCQVSIEVKSLN